METGELVDSHLVLQGALSRLDDEAMRKGITKGRYLTIIQECMDKLAVKTFFFPTHVDKKMPTNLIDSFPDNMFNVRNLYAFNGDSCCNVGASANIYWKRNFNNQPNGQGYTALNKDDEQSLDPFYRGFNGSFIFGNANMKLFAGAQKGMLMFSSACSGYDMYRLEYNSFGSNIFDAPMIPRALKACVQDWVVMTAAEELLARYPKSAYGKMRDLASDKLENRLTGSWWEATEFVKQADNWKRESLEVYEERPNS